VAAELKIYLGSGIILSVAPWIVRVWRTGIKEDQSMEANGLRRREPQSKGEKDVQKSNS
jgi:hypothetical protein